MKTPIFSARLSIFLLTRRRRGFSMLEVLVALFAAFFFLMGTMNAMVVAAVMQVKAERQAQGLFWIQQDLERIRLEASNLSVTQAQCDSTTFAGGVGEALRNSIAANTSLTPNAYVSNNLQVVGSKTFLGRNYRLIRIITADNDNQRVLRLTYRVGLPNDSETATSNPVTTSNDRIQNDQPGNTSIIATLYTEVLPNAALSCP